MNEEAQSDRQIASKPDSGTTVEPGDDNPSSSVKSEDTSRSLVVMDDNPAPAPEGWFSRFLIQVGLRSKGSLRDDLHEALSGEGQAGNVFSPEERAMLQNILRLRELRVVDVMVQRSEIEAVDRHIPLGELLLRFEANGHSRMPVYEENLDDPRGMVLVKDLFLHLISVSTAGSKTTAEDGERSKLKLDKVKSDVPLSKINAVRKIIFVPPSMLAADLMERMQATRTQMALVIDEYGGTDGLVTLEDIVEEVVGEIEDEHDDDEDVQIVAVGEGIWSVDAGTELDDVKEALGSEFDPGERGEDVDTLGGLVYALAGHIPVRGEVVRGVPGYEFRILEADPRRIRRMQIVHTTARTARRKASKVDDI